MDSPNQLIERLAPFHEDAFSWAVTCCGGDVGAAADILQEGYLNVMRGSARFNDRSSLKTWWFSVIRFTAREQERRHGRWRRVAESFRDWISDLREEADAGSDSPPPKIEAERLAAALSVLPARQAEILHLVFQEELSLSEAAAVMAVSVGSVRQHYERAKRRLRQELANSTTQSCEISHAP